MTPKKRVLFLVDFKYRDLAGLTLVKTFLETLGPYEGVLVPNVPTLGEKLYLRSVKPHLVVLPQYFYQSQVDRAYRLKESGIGVAILPAEGTSLIEEFRPLIAGKRMDLKPVDLFFVWNECIQQLSRDHQTIAPERCILGGVPRFDFYTRFRHLISPKEVFCQKYKLDPHHPVVTWATNFGFSIFHGKPAEAQSAMQRLEREGLVEFETYRQFYTRIEQDVESRAVHADGILQIARQFPGVNVVVKVHPSEEGAWYQQKIASSGLTNIKLVCREYIWNVLNATNVHLHRSCTTAIEAWLLNKPTLDLQFAPREYHFSKEIAPGGDVARSLKECLELVGHYLKGGQIPSEQKAARSQIIHWFCGATDGQAAFRHAQAIHRWLSNSKETPSVPPWTREDLLFAATEQIKSLLGLQPYHSVRAWIRRQSLDPREKYFGPEDAQFWTQALQKALHNGAGQPQKDFVHERA